MFNPLPRKRSLSRNHTIPEQLETRLLLTPDLVINFMEPGFLQEVTRETNSDVTASLFTIMSRRNIGTTAFQLNNGTPDPNDEEDHNLGSLSLLGRSDADPPFFAGETWHQLLPAPSQHLAGC